MPKWVPQVIRYEARVTAGPLENYTAVVVAHRERKDTAYSVEVCLEKPGVGYGPLNVRPGDVQREFSSPELALDAGFKALYRRLDQHGKHTLDEIVNDTLHWVYLNDAGMPDYEYMAKHESPDNERFAYTPPTTYFDTDLGREHDQGKAYSTDTETSDAAAGDDHAEDARQHFLGTRGLLPGLTPDIPGDTEFEPLRGPGERGDHAAKQEPASPVPVPRGS